MTEKQLYDSVLAKCVSEFPKFKVTPFEEAPWFIKLLSKIIWKGAAGVTFWNTVFVASGYVDTAKGAQLLSHEIVHVRDQHRWLILFPITYFLILPVGPSLKAVWEWRAYRENLRWVREHPSSDAAYQAYIEDYYCKWVADQFSNSMYLWMWPFWKSMYSKSKNFLDSLP